MNGYFMQTPPSTIQKNNEINIIGKNKVNFITSDNTNLTLPTSGTVTTEGGGGGGGGSAVYGKYILNDYEISIPALSITTGIWTPIHESEEIEYINEEDDTFKVSRGVYLVSAGVQADTNTLLITVHGNGSQTDPNVLMKSVSSTTNNIIAVMDFTGSEQEEDIITIELQNTTEETIYIQRLQTSLTITKIA